MAGPFEEASDSDSITTASTSSSVMEAEYEVEEIKAERAGSRRGQKEYLVKWAGYPLSACTWEPGTSFISKLPLDEWRLAKKKIQRGEATAFDVAEFHAEQERAERVEKERKQRRKKKREKRQRRLAKTLFSSDEDDDNDQGQDLAEKGGEKQSISLPAKDDDDDDDDSIIVVAAPASQTATPPIQLGTDGSRSNLSAHMDDLKIVKSTKGKEPIVNAPTSQKDEPASAPLPYHDIDDADEPLFIAPEAVMSIQTTERPSTLREPMVTLITDDVIRHYPQMASLLVCGLLRKIEQRGRGLVGDKIAMRPGAKNFLFDLAVKAGQQTDKRENPWAQLWADVLTLCPDSDDDPWSRDTCTPDHDAFLVSEPASDFQTTEWHALCQKDERRATEHLVAWFAGWTKLRSPEFADCVVCHKSKDDSTPLADIMGWARQWPHLRIMTPAECTALVDESQ